MKDLRVEIRFKNNILYKKIFSNYNSVQEFCLKYGFFPSTVGGYLNFKISPIAKGKRGGELINGVYVKKSALRIAEALGCLVFEVFPSQLWDAVGKKYTIEIKTSDCFIPYNDNMLISDEDSFACYDFDQIEPVLKMLSEREADIIKKRFGLYGNEPLTLKVIGKQYNVKQQRISQIEAKVLRKLRRPNLSRLLKKQN